MILTQWFQQNINQYKEVKSVKYESSVNHWNYWTRRILSSGTFAREWIYGPWHKRRSSLFNTDRIDHLYQDPHDPKQRLKLHYGDLTDSLNLTRIIQEVQPDEIY